MARLEGFIEDTVAGFAPQLLTDIRFSTSLSQPAVLFNTQDLVRILKKQPAPPPKETAGTRFLRALKPTFVVNSNLLGRQLVAPYGEATAADVKKTVGNLKLGAVLIVVGLIGTGIVLGRAAR